MQMDPLFLAMSFYRRRKFEECAEVCTQLLKKNPYDQVFYFQGDQTKMWWFSPCHFFSCLPLLNGNATFGRDVWYFGILLLKDIFFSFRRLKIHFLSIFCLIRRHGVWKHERSQSKSTSMKLMSMKKELLKCWWTTTLLPSYRVSKTVLALYISFSFNPRSDKQNIFPPPWASKNIPKRFNRIEEKFGKTESGKKRLDHSICFQPCISPERYERLELIFLIFMICPQTS